MKFLVLGLCLLYGAFSHAVSLNESERQFFDESYALLKAAYPYDGTSKKYALPEGVVYDNSKTIQILADTYGPVMPPVMSFETKLKTSSKNAFFNTCVGYDNSKDDSMNAAEIAKRIHYGFGKVVANYNVSANLAPGIRTVTLSDGRKVSVTEIIESQIEQSDKFAGQYMDEQMAKYQKGGTAALDKTSKREKIFMTNVLVYRTVDKKEIVGFEYFETRVESRWLAAKIRNLDKISLAKGEAPIVIQAYGRCLLPLK
ncbi:hypothetical protein [Bdellovibrio sp. NC01]|uniref:hypothetical protein n=1 Tax=Bdellovibrio sp. NC01 TaxID=2220073 RepID=UPI001158F9B3|nr:hypothetical protein [Bdellovibrio sp. NC01]QDK38697.1 hypothetical protein DOE51_14440 [Bdellovibrio sp. NC01]